MPGAELEAPDLAALLARSPLPYAILTRELRIAASNDALATALHAPAPLAGKLLAEAGVHLHVVDAWTKPVQEAFLKGKPHAFEFEGPPDRTLRIYRARVAPLGEHALVTLEDITEGHALRSSQSEAIERAQEARRTAEESAWRGRVLAQVAGLLEEGLRPDAILHRVARLVVPDLADVCIVETPDARGETRIVATAAESPIHEEQLRRLHGAPAPTEADLAPLHVAHGIVVPLATRDRLHGTMRLWFTRAYRRHRPDETAFAQEIARRAAVALEQARLLDEAERARDAAELGRQRAAATAARSQIIADACGALLVADDARSAATALARACVPRLADSCTVDVLLSDGVMERGGIAHVDAQKQALLQQLAERFPPDAMSLPRLAASVGTGLVMPEVTEADVASWAQDDAHADVLRTLAPRSYLVVPLATGGRLVGIMSLTASTSGQRYGNDDLAFARDLATRAAAFIQRAVAVDALARTAREQEDARAALDILSDKRHIAYALVDARMRFLRVSERLARMHGQSAESQAGRPVREAPRELGEAYLSVLRRAMASGEPVTNSVTHTTAGLRVLSAYPVQTSQGPGALLVVDE